MIDCNLVVGQRVNLKRAMLGEPTGSVGYVYETYRDLNVDQRYSMYEFKNVNQVWRDYQNGYWKF